MTAEQQMQSPLGQIATYAETIVWPERQAGVSRSKEEGREDIKMNDDEG
jgi:hypothetical protein